MPPDRDDNGRRQQQQKQPRPQQQHEVDNTNRQRGVVDDLWARLGGLLVTAKEYVGAMPRTKAV